MSSPRQIRGGWSANSRRDKRAVFDVEPGLQLAQDGVVDALLIAQPDHGGSLRAIAARRSAVYCLVVGQRRLVLGRFVADAQHAQVLRVLAAYPSGDGPSVS